MYQPNDRDDKYIYKKTITLIRNSANHKNTQQSYLRMKTNRNTAFFLQEADTLNKKIGYLLSHTAKAD